MYAAFSFSVVTLKFSIHNFFEARVLLKLFDIEFSYKCSAIFPTRQNGVQNRDNW